MKPSRSAPPPATIAFIDDDDDLDDLSNSVIDLIDEGRLDEAEQRCQELRRKHPDLIDWIERSAAVFEARRDWGKAAEYYTRAADFAAERAGDFDPEIIDDFRRLAKRAADKASSS